jgi:hypothetical protein
VKKKLVLFLFFTSIIVGNIFGQEKSANAKNNWISGEVSLPIGIGVRYERMINSNFSFGVGAYVIQAIVYAGGGVDLFGRFFPWGKTFFAELGLGFHSDYSNWSDASWHDAKKIKGVSVVPGLGWKIDVGKPGGFFLSPGLRFPITFGKNSRNNEFDSIVGCAVYFGMGYAF